ncbi:MAG: hypothetical protein KGL39_04585 [Patescibacteria group bacterium]|nr:hypothetical protein [Patescibacteria group bacterium]
MSGGKTQTTSTAPPKYIQNAQKGLISQAQNVASTPYQPYNGSLVAPLTSQQNTALNSISGLVGMNNPYLSQAQNDFANPNAVQQFMSPYTNDVVNATQQQFANQNAITNNGIVGNAITSGAWGGDRAGVAQGIAAGQEQAAQAPVIAGLENQGYQTALNAAQTAGFGLAGLGNEALQTNVAGLQAAGLPQQQQQNVLNTAYQQWLNQQQYPFQTTSWLGNLVNGTAGSAGSTTTSPGPSILGQVAGLGLTALGANQSGIQSGLWNTGSFFGLKHGGKVGHYDDGGDVPYSGDIPLTGLPVSLSSTVPISAVPPVNAGLHTLRPAPVANDNSVAEIGTQNASAPIEALGSGNSYIDKFAANPLVQMGLATLAGTSPFAGVNIGRGGLAALQGLEDQRQKELEARQSTAQTQGIQQSNALNALRIRGLTELQGAMSGNNADNTPQSLSKEAETIGNSINNATEPTNGPLADTSVTGTMPGTMPMISGQRGPSVQSQSVSASPPLFNVADLMQQYRIAATTPGMEGIASQLLSMVEKGTPEGQYMDTSGGIHWRPGAVQNAADMAGAKSTADAWAKVDPEIYTAQNTPKPYNPRLGERFATPAQAAGGAYGDTSPPGPIAQPSPTVPQTSLNYMLSQPAPQTDLAANPTGYQIAQDVLPKQYEAAEAANKAALSSQMQLGEMAHDFAQLGDSGLMAPGTGAHARLEFAKSVNSALTAMGADQGSLPFDTNKIGSWEDLNKNATRLGFSLARTLGSREAMMIVQQATAAVPNMGNSPRGAQRVMSALDAAAQHDSDYYNFLQAYAAKNNGNTFGADAIFNKFRPPSIYAQYAEVPLQAKQDLKSHPELASQFDTHYGSGLSALALGQ